VASDAGISPHQTQRRWQAAAKSALNGSHLRPIHRHPAPKHAAQSHSDSPRDPSIARQKSIHFQALSPNKDDPALGADAQRNNDFLFKEDSKGLKTPAGAHVRRMNPRDSEISGAVRLHRMIRRGTSYGPLLPLEVMEDDGLDRGLAFVFVGTNLRRQFEFVQSEWMGDSTFFGVRGESDPIAGPGGKTGQFTIPTQPIRRRLRELPQFVVTRGSEYFFVPGLRALRWLADLDT
jgi:deferrochelatase/peroxidase EfeB